MTPLEHPSDEQLADLGAGALPPAEGMQLNAHVAECAPCRDRRDALTDLTALLAEVGAQPERMPVDVATSLHAALAAESSRRPFVPARADTRVPATRRRVPTWLAGAAAAVVLTSAGVAAWHVLPNTASDYSADSGSAQEDAVPGLGAEVPGGAAGAGGTPRPSYSDGKGDSFSLRRVAPTAVADAARQLNARGPASVASDVSPCAPPTGQGRREVIKWRGDLAVLVVRPATRSATIFDCATARRVLFTTRY